MSPQQQAILKQLERAGDWVDGAELMRSAGIASYNVLKVQVSNLRSRGAAIESRRGRGGGYRIGTAIALETAE